MNKSKEVNDQVKYGLDSIEDDRSMTISLKDFLFIYKSVEEFRRYFHNQNHYPLLTDVHTYIGNSKEGAISILNELYSKTLDKYIPKDIEDSLGSENDKLTHPMLPYYYNLKQESKFMLTSAGNTEAPAYGLIKELGYDVYKENELWVAEDYNSKLEADSPLELLGLITLYKTKGNDWQVSDDIIDEFIEIDQ